jgi:replicative DNA helicase
MNDRLPPQSQEAEQGILGCILLDPVASIEACTGKTPIGEDAFYDRRNGALFEHMVALYEAGPDV